jgi:hypothetical protein
VVLVVNCLRAFSFNFVNWEEDMKKLLMVAMAVLLVAAVVAPALAWEFEMKGEYEYRLRYFARLGTTDLFGQAPLQDSVVWGDGNMTYVGFAGPRIYARGAAAIGAPLGPITANTTVPASDLTGGANLAGISPASVGSAPQNNTGGYNRIIRGGFSTWDSDAMWSDSRLTITPEIRVNQAVRVHGVYTVGGYRNKYFQTGGIHTGEGLPLGSTPAPPVGGGFLANTYVPAYGAGVPPFERYYVSQTSMNAYDTAAIGSWEQFRATVQLPFGIFSYGVKDFPFGTGATLAYNTRAEAFLTVVPYGPLRILHGWWLTRGIGGGVEGYRTGKDKETRNEFAQGVLVTYDSGAINFGAGTFFFKRHYNHAMIAEQGVNTLNGTPGPAAPLAQDINLWPSLIYFKYNNGKFFANAEYAWVTNDITNTGAAPVYVEGYHFMAEAGLLTGPAKVTLMYGLASGPVLNTGNVTKVYRSWAMNYQAMEPYELLMFNTYAGGNNGGWSDGSVSFVNDDHGMMTDAFCFAIRGDYAVASNLNVWASYLWAHRLEKNGYLKGGTNSMGGAAGAAASAAWVALNYGAASGLVGGPINPFVDDGYLGWEANAGVDWKLLEGFKMNVRYSYWQPGDWFTGAYQAVGVNPPTGVFSQFGQLSGRSPIQAITGSLTIDF